MSVAVWTDEAVGLLGSGAIIVKEISQANLRWANNSLTTNGQMLTRRATVIRHNGDEDIVISGIVSSALDLNALVEKAIAGSVLVFEPVMGQGSDDFFADAGQTSIDVFDALARGLGDSFAQAQERNALLYGFAEHQMTTTWVATTSGIRRRAVVPSGRIELNGKSADLTNSAWVGQSTNDFLDVEIARLTTELWERLAWGQNRIDLPAGRYEVLLPPGATADLLLFAYWAMNARDAREGRSVYSAAENQTRIGQRVSRLPITMWSDPTSAEMPCAPFAVVEENLPGVFSVRDNGTELTPINWITDGVLTSLIETTADGRELVFPTENLFCDASGTATLKEMIAGTRRGLLLTCLWYMREVDPQSLLVTGLTRDGVYLIEDGRIVGSVNNFRFNESPISLLNRATEASVSEQVLCREWNDYFSKTWMPALRIPDFNMSTVSKAF